MKLLVTASLALTVAFIASFTSKAEAQVPDVAKPWAQQRPDALKKARKWWSYAFAANSLNAKVLAFAKANVGKGVGNGECWTLVDQALNSAGAKRPGTGGLGTYQFGTPLTISVGKTVNLATLKPGDILQMWSFRFEAPDKSYWKSGTQHTVIVSAVSGSVVSVYEQNVPSGNHIVRTDEYNMAHLVSGRVEAFRPTAR